MKFYGSKYHVVMEATGYYHYRFAVFLRDKKVAVTVENPLIIKRFIQMQLTKVKTDKVDAQLIYKYGCSRDLKLWEVPSKVSRYLSIGNFGNDGNFELKRGFFAISFSATVLVW